MKVSISVVISTYERPAFITKCLNSLCLQTRSPDEIIVVTKSFDLASRKTIQTYISKYSNGITIKNVSVDELSVLYAENAGIESAKGNILCFIDDDAVAHPDWLARIIDYYQDPSIGGVGGQDIIYEDGSIVNERAKVVGKITWYGAVIGNHHKFVEGVREVDVLKGCNMSFRRELLGRIDERLRGEITYRFEEDICFGIKRQGYGLIYDPAIQVDHYVVRNTGTRRKQNWLPHTLVSNHNYVYLSLKYFSLPRKLIFLLYTFLVGDGGATGLFHTFVTGLREGDWLEKWRTYVVGQRGKLEGIATFLSSLSGGVNVV